MSMIIIPKPVIHVATRATVGMKGFLRFQTRNKFSGKVTQDTGWFPNTILDAGRNIMADRSDWTDFCQVGIDGTFPPTLPERQAETALGNHFAGTDILTGTITSGQSGTSPYYGWKRKTFRFAAGTFDGDILAEAGVGWGASGSTLISRAPILDPILQTPTTVTPLSDEFLDVSYELRYYAPLVDVTTPQVVLDGVTYDTITRAANVNDAAWSGNIGEAIGVVNSAIYWDAWDGNIGTILVGPSGTGADNNGNTMSNSAYSAFSYELKMNCSVGSAGWNLGGGIRSVRIRTTAGDYQTQFDANPGGATIPKTNSYTMTMVWTISWAEVV
jgi:hypothetical protein